MTPERAPNDILTLRDVLGRLWRHRVSLVAFPLIAGALAVAISFLLPDHYRPQAVVSIEMPRRLAGSEPAVPLETVVQTSRHLLGSATMRQAVLAQLAEEGLAFDPDAFQSAMSTGVPRESQLITVSFRDQDPLVATRVTNALAAEVTEQVNAFNESQVERYLERYESDIETARAEVASTEAHLSDFRDARRLELLEERIEVASLRRSEMEEQRLQADLAIALVSGDPIDSLLREAEEVELSRREEIALPLLENTRLALLEQQRRFETSLVQTRVDLAAERESLAALANDLQEQPQRITLQRAIVDDAILQQSLAAAANTDLGAVLAAGIESESLNPVHSEIAADVITARGEVAALSQREAELSRSLESIAAQLASVESHINTGTLAIERAERAVELADEAYRERHVDPLASLRAERALLDQEIASLTASLEAMRTEHHRGTARLALLEQEWTMALERLRAFTDEMAKATLNILEAMPTLAVRLPAVVPLEPESKGRRNILLAGLLLGLAIALFRAYLIEF